MAISKAEASRRQNYHYMADAMRMLEWDLHSTLLAQMRIPADWHQIARDKGESAKRRVTMRIDEDVVKFFQSMGKDWQPRMNRVLAAFMHARLAGLIEGYETMDYMKRTGDDPIDFDGWRPQFGDHHREMVDLGMSEAMAWSGEGPAVPFEDEMTEKRRLRREGEVRLARSRAERARSA